MESTHYIKIVPSLGLLYLGIDYFREYINKVSHEYSYVKYILIDCSNIISLDYTSIKGLENICIDTKIREQEIIFYQLMPSLHEQLQHVLKYSHYCCTDENLRQFLKNHNEISRNSNCSIDINHDTDENVDKKEESHESNEEK